MLNIPLSVPNICGNEQKYINEALHSGWVSTGGSYITRFEEDIKKYTGAAAAAAVASGTAGLHLSLLAIGAKPSDEVLVPTLTFIAAVNPVRYAFCNPVFIDCDDSLCIDPDKLLSFLENECRKDAGVTINKNSGRRVVALSVVHVFGNLADMERIIPICEEYNIKIVEDATEALGTYYTDGPLKGRYAGTLGDISVLSFNGNKLITTGGGGMILGNNTELVEYCRHLSTQAKADELHFIHNEVGYNYRMTNVQAAIGVGQLEMVEQFIATKKENYDLYIENGVTLHPFRKDTRPNYWFYSFLSDDRDSLMEKLAKKGIMTRPVWELIHRLKPYENDTAYKIEKAKYYREKIINLPCSTSLTKDEVIAVCNALKDILS